MQANRNRDGKIIHQRPEGRAFFVHINEQFTKFAVFIFAGAQVDLMTADHSLLGVAFAAMRQTVTGGDITLNDFLDDLRGLGGGWRFHQVFNIIDILIIDQGGGERLAEFRAVTVKRVGFDAQTP